MLNWPLRLTSNCHLCILCDRPNRKQEEHLWKTFCYEPLNLWSTWNTLFARKFISCWTCTGELFRRCWHTNTAFFSWWLCAEMQINQLKFSCQCCSRRCTVESWFDLRDNEIWCFSSGRANVLTGDLWWAATSMYEFISVRPWWFVCTHILCVFPGITVCLRECISFLLAWLFVRLVRLWAVWICQVFPTH